MASVRAAPDSLSSIKSVLKGVCGRNLWKGDHAREGKSDHSLLRGAVGVGGHHAASDRLTAACRESPDHSLGGQELDQSSHCQLASVQTRHGSSLARAVGGGLCAVGGGQQRSQGAAAGDLGGLAGSAASGRTAQVLPRTDYADHRGGLRAPERIRPADHPLDALGARQ